MNKAQLRELISLEVDRWPELPAASLKNKIWHRYFQPESNAVFLIRKYQYHSGSNGKIHKLMSRFLEVRLMRRYGIFIGRKCEIGPGFRIWHPHGIIINNCTIGKNFQVNQNCTLGDKEHGLGQCPTLGDHVTMYADSMVIGNVMIGSNVIIGANSCVLTDAEDNSVYVGSPAKKISRSNEN